MFLTIGNSSAYEIAAFDEVRSELVRLGHESILFKQDRALEGETISYSHDTEERGLGITVDGRTYYADDITGVWYLKPHLPHSLLRHPNIEFRQFIQRQFFALREAICLEFREKKWLNDPATMMCAENKAFQMSVAKRVGLHMPDTLITSDPEKAREFIDMHRQGCVIKQLASCPLPDQVLYTNRIRPEHMGDLDSLAMCPAILQEEVRKEYELRITIVDREVFAAKICSQECAETSLDWRRKPLLNDHEVPMEPCVLPDQVTRSLHRLLDVLGLRFGCIDMIVTPEGRYVFLEVNPNGQWLFLQLKTEMRIARAIARALAR